MFTARSETIIFLQAIFFLQKEKCYLAYVFGLFCGIFYV
jgi:hypothetical protein